MKFPIVLYVVLGCFKLHNGFTISDHDYKKLPPIYDMDDYGKCKEENNVYCKIKYILKPYSTNNSLWQVIQIAKKEHRYFFRDIIYRKRCIPKHLGGNIEEIAKYSTKLENKNLVNISLYAHAEEIKCAEQASYTTFDHIVLFTVAGYLVLVVYATVFDVLSRRNCDAKYCNDKASKQTYKYILALSILNNLQKTKKTLDTSHHRRLKSLNGIKVYNMIVIVTYHSVMNVMFNFISNTEFLEDYLLTFLMRLLNGIAFYLVQTNFLLSAWLFIVNVYTTMDRQKKMTFKVVVQKISDRYLRFIFPLVVYVCLYRSSWIKVNFEGPHNDLMDLDNKACKAYGWTTLIFLNSFFYLIDVCNVVTWFLSCYFQMFVISLLLIYLTFKLNLRVTITFGTMLIISWLIYAYLIYSNNLGAIYKTTPENTKFETLFTSHSLHILYLSIFANFESYIIGLIFGTIYYRHRDRTITANKFMVTTLWAVGFSGLPLLAVLLSLLEYSPVMSAIMGASLKVLFSLGIGIGVLGMSHNIGGFVKKICEWRATEFFVNWMYSVYVFHFAVILLGNVLWKSIITVSMFKVVGTALANLVLSFTAGFVLFLLFEAPFANIVNNWLGQTKVKSS